MRAVWSFWSKPYRAQGYSSWANEKYHLMSWVLSTQMATRWYPSTSLFTDEAGGAVLVDGLGLQFGYVSTELEGLSSVNPELHVLGKVYAYAAQTEPFVHLDGDVFLWKPLPQRMTASPVFAQNPEYFVTGRSHYRPEAFAPVIEDRVRGWVPEEWKWFYGQEIQRGDWCGIFGGNEVGFITRYARHAIRMAEDPHNHPIWSTLIRRVGMGDTCGLVEEYLLAACIEFHRRYSTTRDGNLRIEYLFESVSDAYSSEVAERVGYTHMMGEAKRNRELCRRLENRVRNAYPTFYARCVKYAGWLSQ